MLLTGCRHAPPSTTSTEARGSFELLEPAAPASSRSPSVVDQLTSGVEEDLIEPRLPDNAPQPVVRGALPGGPSVVRSLVVTVTFDETGRVTDVTRSLRGLLVADPESDVLLHAVRDAVLQWKIAPARVIRYQRQPNGERLYQSSMPLGGSLDLKFTFQGSQPLGCVSQIPRGRHPSQMNSHIGRSKFICDRSAGGINRHFQDTA